MSASILFERDCVLESPTDLVKLYFLIQVVWGVNLPGDSKLVGLGIVGLHHS